MGDKKNENKTIYDIIIIGGGPAAYEAGKYIASQKRSHILFEGNKLSEIGGQLTETSHIENFPGISLIDGKLLMSNMRKNAENLGCNIKSEKVIQLDFDTESKLFIVKSQGKENFGICDDLDNGDTDDWSSEIISGDQNENRTANNVLATHWSKQIIFATGATPKRLWGIPGEAEYWCHGISSCAECDARLPRFRNKKIVILGGGDTAMGYIDYLSNYVEHIYVINRGDRLRASPMTQEKIRKKFANENKGEKITWLFNSEVIGFSGNTEDGLDEVIYYNSKTETKSALKVTGLFYAIGHVANLDLIHDSEYLSKNLLLTGAVPGASDQIIQTIDHIAATGSESKDESARKRIKMKTATSIPNFFVAGDVGDDTYRQAGTAAAFGIMAAIDARNYSLLS